MRRIRLTNRCLSLANGLACGSDTCGSVAVKESLPHIVESLPHPERDRRTRKNYIGRPSSLRVQRQASVTKPSYNDTSSK